MKHREDEKRLLAQKDRLFVWLDDVIETETGENYLRASIVYLLRTSELRSRSFFQEILSTPQNMTAYDKLVESTTEQAIIALLKNAHQHGMDITKLANQDYGLSKERVLAIVEKIKSGLL